MSELVLTEELSHAEIQLLKKSAMDYVISEGLDIIEMELMSTRCNTVPSYLFVPIDLVPEGY